LQRNGRFLYLENRIVYIALLAIFFHLQGAGMASQIKACRTKHIRESDCPTWLQAHCSCIAMQLALVIHIQSSVDHCQVLYRLAADIAEREITGLRIPLVHVSSTGLDLTFHGSD